MSVDNPVPPAMPAAIDQFVLYYARQSVSEETFQRFQTVKRTVERMLASSGRAGRVLEVADIGCGAGTQCMLWAQDGHRVHGLDINRELIMLGRERAAEAGLSVDLREGTAQTLPWASSSVDVCLLPELLEHVADWHGALSEAARILRPGGVLYLSTTNRLCPMQAEFDLPLYSWYPQALKRRYERLAVTSRPELVAHASYPAIHWFTFYSLRRALRDLGFGAVLDRFDLIDLAGRPWPLAAALRGVRALPPLRWLGQVATPYTVALAFKAA